MARRDRAAPDGPPEPGLATGSDGQVDEDQHGQEGQRAEREEDVPDVSHVGPLAFAQDRSPVDLDRRTRAVRR